MDRTSSPDIDATRAAARRYIELGYTPIGYEHRKKFPTGEKWQKKTRDKIDVDKEFVGHTSNVGVLLGKPSANLVDVDLDCPEAVRLAPHLLPPTSARFGRPSKPSSHYLFRAEVTATQQWSIGGEMLVELRSTGGQTMFPPSVHPTGERVAWDNEGDPAEFDGQQLAFYCQRLAVGALVLRAWQPGVRNKLGLCFAGTLLSHGWNEDGTETFLRIIAQASGDKPSEVDKSASLVAHTARRLTTKRPCAGLPSLAKMLGVPADTLREWIDRRPLDEQGVFASSDPIYLARQFAKTLDDVWHWRTDFYRWSGSWWVLLDAEELKGRLYPWLEQMRVMEKGKPVPIRSTCSLVRDVLAALAGVRQLPNTVETPFWIDRTGDEPLPADLLPFRNGTLDLNTFSLHPPDRRLFALHGVECNYDPNARAPTWARFMHDAFPDDQQSINCLSEILGYCITGDTSLQKAFIFIGPKRSGKSTIARVARAVVGQGRYANPSLSDFGEQFGLENLVGRTLAVIADARGHSRSSPHKAVEHILAITGEDGHSINRKFKGRWNGVLPTRIILASNTAPKLIDPTGVVVSRFIAIAFEQSFFGRENPRLTEELLAELPGIINVWLEGLRRLRKRGRFEQPDSGLELLELMDENASPLKRFVEEMCVTGPEHEILKSLLYVELNNWLRDRGHHPMADETIGSDLYGLHRGIRSTRHRQADGTQPTYYTGITLVEMHRNGGKVTPSLATRVFNDVQSGEV